MKFEIENETQYRAMELDRNGIDEEARTIPASLSSETPVERSFGREVLVHNEKSIDLARAKNGLPLLFSHDDKEFIGRVRSIEVKDGKLRGMLHFSDNAKASEVWSDVRSGMLQDMSIGYRINKWEEDDEEFRATNWSLIEASVVACPADPTVGINRSKPKEVTAMENENGKNPDNGKPSGESVVVDILEATRNAKTQGESEGIKAERKRISDIKGIFALHSGDEVRSLETTCINNGLTLEASQRNLLQLLGNSAEPLGDMGFKQDGKRTDARVGRTELEKTLEGIGEAIEIRANMPVENLQVKRAENPYVSMSLSDMAREYLRVRNVSLKGLDKMGVAGKAFQRDFSEVPFDQTVADFPALLENIANKNLQQGYTEAPETWNMWARIGAMPDFKAGTRPNMSQFPDIDLVAENASFPLKQVSDWKEPIQVATYGARFSITRQAIVNDDLAAFTRIPANMGRAANRKVGDLTYAKLLTVHTMTEDSNPLFDAANHNNVFAAGAPDVATVDAIRVAMGTQTDPSGATLNLRPDTLICGLGYEGVATTLRNAQYDPATTAGTLMPNYVAGTFKVVADPRIDNDANATNWFMTSSQYDFIEVAFLNGVNAPFLDRRSGFEIDGEEYKVRLDFGVGVLDWRTAALNGTAPV